jgi:hypothetical protein
MAWHAVSAKGHFNLRLDPVIPETVAANRIERDRPPPTIRSYPSGEPLPAGRIQLFDILKDFDTAFGRVRFALAQHTEMSPTILVGDIGVMSRAIPAP